MAIWFRRFSAKRVTWRGSSGFAWGWGVAYNKSGIRKGKAIEGNAVGGD